MLVSFLMQSNMNDNQNKKRLKELKNNEKNKKKLAYNENKLNFVKKTVSTDESCIYISERVVNSNKINFYAWNTYSI